MTNLRPILFVLLLLAAGVAVITLPVADGLAAALRWIDTNREIAWIVYIAGYIAATVLLIPGSLITLAAGFIFGLPAGVALVSAGSVLGCVAAFLIGRWFVRDWVSQKIADMPKFNALYRATGEDGFLIVLLTRLSPLFPFNLLNYAYGLTSVRVRDYFLASWLGMLPGTVLYVYLGTLAGDLAAIASGEVNTGPAGTWLLAAGLIATALVTIVIARRATAILTQRLTATSAANDD